jgi:hypothetical protein
MKRSDQIRQRVTREMLEYECNTTLAERPRDPATLPPRCGDHWCTRFIRRHLTFRLVEETTQELDRQAAEDPARLAAWFEEFAQVVAQNGFSRVGAISCDLPRPRICGVVDILERATTPDH